MNGALVLIMTKVFELIGAPDENFAEWWKDANRQKNDGFYVGYFGGKWNFPSETPEATYQRAQSMAKPFVESLAIIHTIRESDHLLFSKNKEFTQQEIESSGYKMFSEE